MTTPEADVHPPSSLSGADLLSGTAYRALSTLGHGTMGQVIEAEHAIFGRVVVKLLRAELADRADLVDRMRLEAEVLARLAHPNIVRLLEFRATTEGRPFLVMERLAGTTLRDEVRARGRLSIVEAIVITQQTLAGLRAAHAAGILHRDIKPANLFLTASDAGRPLVKILDFGVAKVLTQTCAASGGPAPLHVSTAPGMAVGTPRFLSPEQIRGRPLDARADLYAVGLVLYTMLVGKGPFDDITDLGDMMRAHVEIIPPLPSSYAPAIPRPLDLIIMKALAKRPDDRFGSTAEFLAQLERIITDGPRRAAVASLSHPTAPLPPAWNPTAGMTIPLPPLPAPPRSDGRTGRTRTWDDEALETTLKCAPPRTTLRLVSVPNPPVLPVVREMSFDDRLTPHRIMPATPPPRTRVYIGLLFTALVGLVLGGLVALFSVKVWMLR